MVYDYLENDNLPNETKMAKRISIVADQFVIKEVILYHIEIPHGAVARDIFRIQLFLPQTLRHNVVLETHHQLHLAVDKMCMKLKLEFWWTQMMREVQRCIDNCSVCQADRKLRNPYQPPLKSPKCPNSPGESWVIDHVGPWIQSFPSQTEICTGLCRCIQWICGADHVSRYHRIWNRQCHLRQIDYSPFVL